MNVRKMFRDAQAKGEVDFFVKKGVVKAREVKSSETVETFIGTEKETVNTAKPGDFIVCGERGERYVVTGEKFKERYEVVDDTEGIYKAIGSCYAFKIGNDVKSFTFTAPWGEEMICNPGDYIATTDVNDPDLKDVYRIERSVFIVTYQKA